MYDIGDKVYFLDYSTFKKQRGKCPRCNGSGILRGVVEGFPQLMSSCPDCHATGTVEKLISGYYIIGPKTIVDKARENIFISGDSMYNDMIQLVERDEGTTLRDAFRNLSFKYTWQRVKKTNAFYSKEDAIKEIINRKGILVGE